MVAASGGMSVKACYHSRLRPARFCADSHQVANRAGLSVFPATGDNAGASATTPRPEARCKSRPSELHRVRSRHKNYAVRGNRADDGERSGGIANGGMYSKGSRGGGLCPCPFSPLRPAVPSVSFPTCVCWTSRELGGVVVAPRSSSSIREV